MTDTNNSSGGSTKSQPEQPHVASYGKYGYGYGYLPYGPISNWRFGDGLSLALILRVLWRKKVTFVAMTVFVVLSAVFYLHEAVPVYESRSVIELSVRRPRIMSQQDAVINDVGSISAAEMLNTQLLKLQGVTVRRIVMESLRNRHPDLVSTNDEDALKYLEGNVKIELIRRSSLVTITAASSNAVLARDMANTYANTAVSNAFTLNKDASDGAVEWLQEQAVAQRKTLQQAEESALNFNKQNQIATLESLRKTSEEAMLTYNKELAGAIAAREAAFAKYTEKHPEVRALDQQIEAIRKQLDLETERTRNTDIQIAEASTRLKALQRDTETCEINYKGILHRMEEARLSADEKTATIKISEPAEIPQKPAHPNKLLVLLLAVVCGPVFGGLLSLFSNKLENRVWNPDETAQETGLLLLGSIPHVRRRDREKLAFASHTEKFDSIAESFAAVRAVVDSDKDIKSILVTSSSKEEGKTICSCNLAISWAHSGLKTLLVDLDMRRPRLRKMFKLLVSGKNVFHVQVLADEASQDFAALPVKSDIPNLDIIPTLPSSASPAEILGSLRIQKFLSWASENYDRIVLDSPPMNAASDSMQVGSAVNGVILVCRFNRSKKSMLQFAMRRLQDCGAKMIGLIVNDVRVSKLGYYDNYRYHTYETSHYKSTP
jgi:capsular exopolysaccharide synthesis family protein